MGTIFWCAIPTEKKIHFLQTAWQGSGTRFCSNECKCKPQWFLRPSTGSSPMVQLQHWMANGERRSTNAKLANPKLYFSLLVSSLKMTAFSAFFSVWHLDMWLENYLIKKYIYLLVFCFSPYIFLFEIQFFRGVFIKYIFFLELKETTKQNKNWLKNQGNTVTVFPWFFRQILFCFVVSFSTIQTTVVWPLAMALQLIELSLLSIPTVCQTKY